MTRRKYIRIALTPDDEAEFQAAKAKVETKTSIAMSDSMYALSVIRQSFAAQAAIDRIIKSG
jgi:hypothetical protein